jgi:hypothetical protein
VIKGWLDPVVANKVNFTNNAKEMEEFIPRHHILKELDGDEDWEYKYLEPVAGENDKMKDVETRDRMLAARAELAKEFERATMQWIHGPDGDESQITCKNTRNALAARLREDYWNLDPYVRARSVYDRTGVLQPGGELNFYPQSKLSEKINGNGNGTAAAPAVETLASDVD